MIEDSIKIATWNVRGLRDEGSRATVFAYLKQLQMDIIALQETHADHGDHRRWTEQWRGPAAWTPHVGLLLREDAHLSFISEPTAHLDGRVLAAQVRGDKLFSTINIYAVYAPVQESERADFVVRLQGIVRPGTHIIVMGDLNAAPCDE